MEPKGSWPNCIVFYSIYSHRICLLRISHKVLLRLLLFLLTLLNLVLLETLCLVNMGEKIR